MICSITLGKHAKMESRVFSLFDNFFSFPSVLFAWLSFIF